MNNKLDPIGEAISHPMHEEKCEDCGIPGSGHKTIYNLYQGGRFCESCVKDRGHSIKGGEVFYE